ncbi:MAG: AraC family transcriptional regulator [Clostridia bacterium]
MDNISVKKFEYRIIPTGYSTFTCNSGGTIPYTRSNDYILHFIYSGSGVFYTPRGFFSINSGQVFVVRPDEMTRYVSDDDSPLVITSISFDIMGVTNVTHIPYLEFLTTDVFTSYESQLLFEKVKQIKTPSQYDYIFLVSVLYELIWNINKERENALNAPFRDYVDIGLSYIHNHYAEKITIASISSYLGIDSRYFSTLFHNKIGVSPQRYLIDFRLSKATSLLSNGYTVTYAAQSCGYFDIFNFSKMFKKKFGMTPSQYALKNSKRK